MSTTLPLFLFPDVSWFLQYAADKECKVSLQGVYEKQTAQSRYCIAAANNLQLLSVPVKHTGTKQWLSEVKINRDENWALYHAKAMKTAYAKAPFYEFYDYKIEKIINKNHENLQELAMASVQFLLDAFYLPLPEFTNEKPTIKTEVQLRPYSQVFEDKHGFRPQVSALDLLFNLGPEAGDYLTNTG